MLANQYSHRLPADYDMERIYRRATSRGALWDATPGLAFKAFVARRRGEDGAAGNLYASVYLWLDVSAAADFVLGERFQTVIDGFGRPAIETWLPIDARTGRAGKAKVLTLYREDTVLADTADHAAAKAQAIEQNRLIGIRDDTVAVVAAIDVSNWRLTRFTLSSAPADSSRPGLAYQVFHLSGPGLDKLP